MEKNVHVKSKGSINGSSYNNNNGGSAGAGGNKPPSRVTKAGTGKRPSGAAYYGDNLNAAQCVEEIKNTFHANSLDPSDREEPLSAGLARGSAG